MVGIKNKEEIIYIKSTELPISDRYSTGSVITKHIISDVFIKSELIKRQEMLIEEVALKEVLSLKEIDERIMTIDDFLNDFDK
jgi:hypothetical protein